MGSNIDLRKYMEDEKTHEAFSLLVSGKKGYKAIIERKKEIPKCSGCNNLLSEKEKFCSECGTKIEQKVAPIQNKN